MAKELTKLWEGLKLTEIEKEEVNFSMDDNKCANARAHICLLLLILMDNNLNKEAFKATLIKVWNPDGFNLV